MSQTTSPGGGRYSRSSAGLIGAMLVTVLFILAFVGFRGLFRDNDSTPVRTVDYQSIADAARRSTDLQVLAPKALPTGWRSTTARFTDGRDSSWHLGLLTAHDKYVGLEEARASVAALVEEYVDEDATQGADVTLGGVVWQTWTDAGGDYALGRSLGAGDDAESVVVVGAASKADIESLAADLRGREG